MRVAMVCAQAPPVYGGAGTQALALGAQLVRRGIEVDLLTANQSRAPRVEVITGVTVRRCRGEGVARLVPRRPAEVFRTISYSAWLFYRLLRGRYDLLHVHGNYWFGLAPALVARITRRPLVVKITRLGDDDALSISQKRFRSVSVGTLYSIPTRSASVVVALNPEIAERHRVTFPTVPLVTVPNGVDLARFAVSQDRRTASRNLLGIPHDVAVALFVGHLTTRKGVAELLTAWRDVVGHLARAGRQGLLLVVGPDRGAYREIDVEPVGRDEGRSDGIRVLRHVPFERMPDIYAAADVFVLPTHAEGMPNSLLEALAAGLTVVASRIPGITEILATDTDSVLLDSVTVPELSAALESTLAARSGHARASRVPAHLMLENVAGRYSEIYARLAELPRDALPVRACRPDLNAGSSR